MAPSIPLLMNGDRLTRAEFERRYEQMPAVKAELIDGVVFVASPVSVDHSGTHALIVGWLTSYVAARSGIAVHDNVTIRLDEDNEAQPDACLVRAGHPRDGKYFGAAPPLVVEVAYTSASYDLHQKKEVYRRHRCAEYVVAIEHSREVTWLRNEEGTFVPVEPVRGVFRSREFPGLWLDAPALFAGDAKRVLGTLKKGLSSRRGKP